MPRQKRATAAGAVGYAIVAGVVGLGVYHYHRQTLAQQGWSELARSPGLSPVVRPVTPALSLSPAPAEIRSRASQPERIRVLRGLFGRR